MGNKKGQKTVFEKNTKEPAEGEREKLGRFDHCVAINLFFFFKNQNRHFPLIFAPYSMLSQRKSRPVHKACEIFIPQKYSKCTMMPPQPIPGPVR